MSVELKKNMNASREALESVRKDANDPTLSVGDIVFSGGVYAAVIEIKTYAPGAHGDSPIRNDWTAVRVVTDMGTSRWHGAEPITSPEPTPAPQSGYTLCACRDCMDVAITSDGKPALCLLCKGAGCEISYGKYMDGNGSVSLECQRDDAYGA